VDPAMMSVWTASEPACESGAASARVLRREARINNRGLLTAGGRQRARRGGYMEGKE